MFRHPKCYAILVKSYIARRPFFGVAVILLERRLRPCVSPLRKVSSGQMMVRRQHLKQTHSKKEELDCVIKIEK